MFTIDIEKATLENNDYRRVIKTTPNQQLVLMSILPTEDVHLEIHPNTDQFVRFEAGNGKVIIGKDQKQFSNVKDGTSVTIKMGTWHRIVNTGNDSLKLYTIYSPPEHPAGLVQHRQVKEKNHSILENLLLF